MSVPPAEPEAAARGRGRAGATRRLSRARRGGAPASLIALALLACESRPRPHEPTPLRISSVPADPAADSLQVLGRRVDERELVRVGVHFPAQRLDALVRRECVFLEVPSIRGLEERSAVLWLPRRGPRELAQRFALVVTSSTPVDPHYLLAWTQAGAFVLDLSPAPLRAGVVGAAGRLLAERFALSPQQVGLDLHMSEEEPHSLLASEPHSGPFRDAVHFPFGFGVQLGGDAREIRALLPDAAPHRAADRGADPRFAADAARELHAPRFTFVDQVLRADVPLVPAQMQRRVAGRWARVELWAAPALGEVAAQRAMEDAERVFAETDSIAAALDAGIGRLHALGVRAALMRIGPEACRALGPPAERPAYEVPLPEIRPSATWVPVLSLRDCAVVQVGSLLDPLKGAIAVCVQAPTARGAERLAPALRAATDLDGLRAALDEQEGVGAWSLHGDGERLHWRSLVEWRQGPGSG